MKRICILILSVLLAVQFLSGCDDETEKIVESERPSEELEISGDAEKAAAKLGLEFLKNDGENTNPTVSPFSLYTSLSLVASGANGKTKSDIEKLLLTDTENAEKNVASYTNKMIDAKMVTFTEANGIFVKSKTKLEKSFTDNLKKYFAADVFTTPFDESTVKQMNAYFKNKSGKRIKEACESTPENAEMFVLGTLTFDAKWDKQVLASEISPGIFKCKDGNDEKVDYLSMDGVDYIKLGDTIGIRKDYEGCEYSFIAFLPSDGMSAEDFVNSLSPEDFITAVKGRKILSTTAKIPRFTASASYNLENALPKLGVSELFGENADFSKMSKDDLKLSGFIHKAYIMTSEKGTEDGASTTTDLSESEDLIELVFDSPFFYAVVDKTTGMPFYMGIVNKVE